MQFDKFDNKAREAAENHHPPYNEQAWAKMEKLLDKHMPQEEDDRRRVLFFLLLIIGLGGAGLFIAKPWKGKQTRAAATQSVQQVQAMQQALTSKTGKEAKGINKTVVKESDKVITSIVPTVNSKPVINPYLPNQHDDKFNNKTQRKSRLKPQPVIITNSVNSSIENDKPTADIFTNSEKEKSLTVVEFDKQLTTPPVTKNSDQINGAAVKENDTIKIASTDRKSVV